MTVHEHDGVHHVVGDALPVVVPRVRDWQVHEISQGGEGIFDADIPRWISPDVLTELWAPSKGNVFVEFQLGAYLVSPSDREECHLDRALWILLEPDAVCVVPVFEIVRRRVGDMLCGPSLHFIYREGEYEVSCREGDCQERGAWPIYVWWLSIFCRVTRWLRDEECFLTRG